MFPYFEDLRVTRDGNTFCVTFANFIDLQSSPAIFFDSDSWQGKVFTQWWEATPLLHLPAIEIILIRTALAKMRERQQPPTPQ